MSTDNAPIKNLGLLRVTLIPVTVTNPDAGNDAIVLNCTKKSLPGVQPANTWTINSDDPEQEIAETVAGKFGGLSVLEFVEVYDMVRIADRVKHANTDFDVQMIYNDPKLPIIVAITAVSCRMVSPGETGGAQDNESSGECTIKLQPSGGGKIADCLKVVVTPRT